MYYNMKNINILKLTLLVHLFIGSMAYAASYIITPSDTNIFYYKNSDLTKLRNGLRDFKIPDNKQTPTYYHDLLMHFDSNLTDVMDNYKASSIDYDDKYGLPRYGTASLFLPNKNYFIELIPKPNTFFNTSNNISSFTIEFFLKPAKFLINNKVLSKLGPYETDDGQKSYGGMIAYVEKNRLVWKFDNFFFLNGESKAVELSVGSFLNSEEWSHHSISFDASTGRLTKYLNGREEEIVYVTSTGQQYGSIYYPKFDSNNQNSVYLGGGFLGEIDEFSITKVAKNKFNIEQYRNQSEVVTKVIDLESQYSFISNINVERELKNGNDVFIYYRASQMYFLENDIQVEWKTFDPNSNININSRYIQIKLIFASSGNNETTPMVGRMSIDYEILPPPTMPTDLKAYASDKSVKLVWRGVSQFSSVTGYKIYYGTKPGIYDTENSPIVVSKTNEYIINNLKNDTLYYFTISAFDNLGENHQSEFAKEVYARPRSFYSNNIKE